MTLLTDVSGLFSGLDMPYVSCPAGQSRVSEHAMLPACSTAETRRAQCVMQLRFLTLYSYLQFCCWPFIFTRSFPVHLVPDHVLVVRRRTPSFTFFSSHMLRALLVYSISYLGQDCLLRHFHKTDQLDPHICCLGWYPNIYVLHVWESVWKASAATAGFQQNFEQNLLP